MLLLTITGKVSRRAAATHIFPNAVKDDDRISRGIPRNAVRSAARICRSNSTLNN